MKHVFVVAATSALLLSACATKPSAVSNDIAVNAKDTSCELSKTKLKAGTYTFNITNNGKKVTEFYVYAKGNKIVGEVENIGPGLSRDMTVSLPKGSYEGACKPGMTGDGVRQKFTVTGELKTSDSAELQAAANDYSQYVASESEQLVSSTTQFVAAVKAGNVDQAKALYPEARTHWERIEPVAEMFGDLDPITDGREADAAAEDRDFTGWHRIEKQLWVDGNTEGMDPYADQLLANVKQIVDEAAKKPLTALEIAQGTKGLLDEVATSKITGEEDEFSHTDLWDFRANIDGSEAAINALRPVLQAQDPELLSEIETRFAALDAELDQYRAGEDDWQSYTQLSQAQIKALSDAVAAVSEPVSQVAAIVAAVKSS
jgi:iron uptake system component EfeO